MATLRKPTIKSILTDEELAELKAAEKLAKRLDRVIDERQTVNANELADMLDMSCDAMMHKGGTY